MTIRLATFDDINSIRCLNQEFWKYNTELQPDYYADASDNGDYPRRGIVDPDSDLIVAEIDNTIVGLIHVRKSQTPSYLSVVNHEFVEVIDLIVSASFRRRRIGTMLMDSAKEWGKSRNLDYIELFVLSNAKGEIAFYNNYGFTTDSLTMRYKLHLQ